MVQRETTMVFEQDGTFSIFLIYATTNIFAKRGCACVVIMLIQQMSNLRPDKFGDNTSGKDIIDIF